MSKIEEKSPLEIYDDLVNLNKDMLYMYLEQNVCDEYHQCINVS